ncbi:hypothetical protein VN97_g747 [Penicillium thymicola]|uniref:Uncharacterized protein n=1 Tax=Penicillium thymicola TaxID=293382 RepID=A0AAI9TSY9_PENTH|nr:hypothetical protein VN97_g747 [Penicillium thymicola]
MSPISSWGEIAGFGVKPVALDASPEQTTKNQANGKWKIRMKVIQEPLIIKHQMSQFRGGVVYFVGRIALGPTISRFPFRHN